MDDDITRTWTPGDMLAAARRRRLLTQDELAATVGVSARSIREWEAGRSRPTLANLGKLAEALELDEEAVAALAE